MGLSAVSKLSTQIMHSGFLGFEYSMFVGAMSDYVEIKGQSVIYIDTETGEPLPAEIVRAFKRFRTPPQYD